MCYHDVELFYELNEEQKKELEEEHAAQWLEELRENTPTQET